MKKLTIFTTRDEICPVSFVETQEINEGVESDIYAFTEDSSKDLAIVKVIQGYRTPLREVLLGSETIEGFVEGEGTLKVQSINGTVVTYYFTNSVQKDPVVVLIGERMQWHADGQTDLIFYEVCESPYERGRFKNLSGEL